MSQATKDPRCIVLGVCSMAKKANSKPMHEILDRITKHFPRIKAVIFDENTVLCEPPEKWPVCDALISFHSRGFPQDKVLEYVNLRQPYLINDIEWQYLLLDRRSVYEILHREGIPHPRYAILDRDRNEITADSFDHDEDDCGSNDSYLHTDTLKTKILETEDSIEIDGVTFTKPFVEKPVNAENHNIVIYFPQSAGGGSQRLFRKIDNKASTYSRCSRVRRVGSYLYEEFMPTDGTDVKVYTVGSDYTHAEARKAPALDGVVERDADGKEVRYPVILSNREKLIARAIVRAFKQQICGFDLLRANGRSYVCDVNGFSFVKNSKKYYDDCSSILGTLIMRQANVVSFNLELPLPTDPPMSAPFAQINVSADSEKVDMDASLSAANDDEASTSRSSTQSCVKRDMMELRCLLAIIRHGDRTPKQKCKVVVTLRCFFELFEKQGGMEKGKLKLKKPRQLQEVLDLIRSLLAEPTPSSDVLVNRVKFEQIKAVLEMHGHFSGINRKVQFKLTERCPASSPPPSVASDATVASSPHPVQSSKALLLIVKWGGELTKWGKEQAVTLGRKLRSLYPGGEGAFANERNLGLLRLHSTFRHDLKIYASDEGRVQMTAAAFAKGFLALEGELPPILVQMVKSANTSGLLDNEGDAKTVKLQRAVRSRLQELINSDTSLTEPTQLAQFAPTGATSLLKACAAIGNPRATCLRVRDLIRELLERVRQLAAVQPQARLYHGESISLIERRWSKLEKELCVSATEFEASKIPDVYDNVKYDYQHNQAVLQFEKMDELHSCAKSLADLIVPQEYGITKQEKLEIALAIGSPLLRKILVDLHWADADTDEGFTRLNSNLVQEQVSSPERFVRTRLYFTSESHLISLFSCLRYGNLFEPTGSISDAQWDRAIEYMNAVSELNYLTQIVFLVYENPLADAHSKDRFGVELHFSPGADTLQGDQFIERKTSNATLISNLQLDAPLARFARSPKRYDSQSSLDDSAFNDDRQAIFSNASAGGGTPSAPSSQPLIPSTSVTCLLSSQPSINHADLTEQNAGSQRNAALVLPLSPLHNALTLRGLETFLERIIARTSSGELRPIPPPGSSFQLPTICCALPICYCDAGSTDQQMCAVFRAHSRAAGSVKAASAGDTDAASSPALSRARTHSNSSSFPNLIKKKISVPNSPEGNFPPPNIKLSASPPWGGFLTPAAQYTGTLTCASSNNFLKRMRRQAESVVEHDFIAYCEKLKAKAVKKAAVVGPALSVP